jgi:hypothetical protein
MDDDTLARYFAERDELRARIAELERRLGLRATGASGILARRPPDPGFGGRADGRGPRRSPTPATSSRDTTEPRAP